jgi:hypothetical protein
MGEDIDNRIADAANVEVLVRHQKPFLGARPIRPGEGSFY